MREIDGMTFKRLAICAVSIALLMGLAPMAQAQVPPFDAYVCNSSSDPSNPLGGAGDGITVAGGTSGNDMTCSFTTTGAKTLNYVVQSGNAWEITTDNPNDVNPVASAAATFPSGVFNDTFDEPADVTVTLTVHPTCDPSGGLCGFQATALVGANN